MMMRSGEATAYKGMVDCGSQIIKSEGVPALFKVSQSDLPAHAIRLRQFS